MSASPFNYCLNNPVYFIDPNGMSSKTYKEDDAVAFALSLQNKMDAAERKGMVIDGNERFNVNLEALEDWNPFDIGGGGGDGMFYREKGAQKGEFLNFDNSLLNRFKDSKLDPYAEVDYKNRNAEIMKVIESVKGLKELYLAMGSPKITDYGRSTEGHRGFTFPDNDIAIYNSAYMSYFYLASTIFHELV